MSETWRGHLEANALFFNIWSIGDRGPLYGVLHSFFYRALEPESAQYVNYVRLGALLNAMYVCPLFLWIYRRSGDARIASAVVVLVALNPWFLLNVYFTWPKMLSGALILTALFMLWDEDRPGVYHYIAAGGAFGLGVLSHAASALSFPVFYLFTLGLHVRSLPDLRRSLLKPLTISGLMVPWLVYKQIYSPETFNIVTMNYLDGARLAGC